MNLKDATILIVDDEPILRLTFSVVLKQHVGAVHVAADGLQALEVLEREHVDAMVTDKQMPLMDGVTLLRTLAERQRRVPSILFVNGVEGESAAEMHRLGVVEFVTKPLHPERLVRVLDQVVQSLPLKG